MFEEWVTKSLVYSKFAMAFCLDVFEKGLVVDVWTVYQSFLCYEQRYFKHSRILPARLQTFECLCVINHASEKTILKIIGVKRVLLTFTHHLHSLMFNPRSDAAQQKNRYLASGKQRSKCTENNT